MITEVEISHQNNNFFDLSHPTHVTQCWPISVQDAAADRGPVAAVPALPPLQLRPLGPRHPGRAQGRQVQEVRLSCCSLNFIFENNNITAYASSTLEHLDHCLLLLYVPIAPTTFSIFDNFQSSFSCSLVFNTTYIKVCWEQCRRLADSFLAKSSFNFLNEAKL